MIDNPKPDLETVRGIVEQIARGLQAFHRLEMLHQDLRPDNIMIDTTGTVKIIDFGSTRVAGVVESRRPAIDATTSSAPRNTPRRNISWAKAAPPRSDIFSLGVIAYQMLTGRLPYGAEVAKARTRSQQRKLAIPSALDDGREIPAWIDEVLEQGAASRSLQALRGAVRIRPRPAPSEPDAFSTRRRAADRAQSAAVLEMRFGDPRGHRCGAAVCAAHQMTYFFILKNASSAAFASAHWSGSRK